jgi:aspartyl/asparaginyl-tRNA synthetase
MASPSSSLGFPSDVFVVTHYPKNVRPFNFYPSDDDPESTTNSFDIIIRGQECCTSAQLQHSHTALRAAMTANSPPIDPDSPEWHAVIAAYETGLPPWGGYGSEYHVSLKFSNPRLLTNANCFVIVGLNRFVQGFLGLQDIRETVLFPRDGSRLAP